MTLLHGKGPLFRRPAKGFASAGAKRQYAPDLQLEPVHLEIDLGVDLDGRTLEVTLRHTVRANTAGADTLRLHGVDLVGMQVVGESLRWSYDGEELEVVWPRRFGRGEERALELRYRVREPRSGLFFSGPCDDTPDAPRLAITDHETERARHWLCTVDQPAVRPTLQFAITAKEQDTILANGGLVSETSNGDGTKTAVWACKSHVPSYLTCFAVGELVRWDGGEVDGVEIAAFAPAKDHDEANLECSFRRTADMLEWLPERLGTPFPYEKYFQVAAPFIGGAMENISLTTWDDRFVLDEALESEERQLLDVINLHEMAHTWFGDLIICRDYAHAWLKESWATYMETCWLEHDLGVDAMQHDLWRSAEAYFGECDTRYVRPIVTREFDTSWDMYDYHLYPGGAWRLHMLRRMLGEQTFWAAVRQYVDHYAGELVETDDFRRTLESVSGRSLARFFDEWIHAPGFPVLKGRFRYEARTHTGVFELEQKQVDAKKGIGLFDLAIDLAWWIDGERREQRAHFGPDGRLVLHVEMASAPTRVRVDPHLAVLHRLELDLPDAMWRAQLAEDEAFGRMQAARALAKKGRREDLAAVAEAYRKERFWGVRAEFATALGKAANEASLEVLLGLAADDVGCDASRPALYRALGTYRDARVVEVLVSQLEAGRPPQATAAALDALGAQRAQAPHDVLLRHGERRERSEFGAMAAARAMAASRSAEGRRWLLAHAAPGTLPDRTRPAVVAALGTCLGDVEEHARPPIVEALEDRLRDPIGRVRDAAARALVGARSHGSAAALDAYRAQLPAQYQAQFDRRLEGMRRRAKGGSHDRLERAEKRVRELEGRLEKLEAKSAGSALNSSDKNGKIS